MNAERAESIIQSLPDVVEAKDKEISSLRAEIATIRTRNAAMEKVIRGFREKFAPDFKLMQELFSAIESVTAKESADSSKYDVWLNNSSLLPLTKHILRLLIAEKHLTKQQILLRLGKKQGGHFNNCMSQLTSAKLMKRVGEEYVLEEIL